MFKRKKSEATAAAPAGRPSALIDTRVIYCGDCLDQLRRLPNGCLDRLYLWHRFPTGDSHSRRNYEVFWGALSEPRAPASEFPARIEDRHASTAAYIDYLRPRCVELARVLKKKESLYYHCDWHARRDALSANAKASCTIT